MDKDGFSLFCHLELKNIYLRLEIQKTGHAVLLVHPLFLAERKAHREEAFVFFPGHLKTPLTSGSNTASTSIGFPDMTASIIFLFSLYFVLALLPWALVPFFVYIFLFPLSAITDTIENISKNKKSLKLSKILKTTTMMEVLPFSLSAQPLWGAATVKGGDWNDAFVTKRAGKGNLIITLKRIHSFGAACRRGKSHPLLSSCLGTII